MNINREDVIKLQEEMSLLVGCPGREREVAEYLAAAVRPYADKVWIDGLGNVLAVKEGTDKKGERILLDAHMDEVGFMVNHIDREGFLRISSLGGIDKRILPGALVQFQADNATKIKGVIGSVPPHISFSQDRDKAPEISELFVDIGAASAGEVEGLGLHMGSVGTFYTPFTRLNDNIIMGKAFDDRTGCNILLNTLKLLKDEKCRNTILVNFSVQEEFKALGAAGGTFALDPTIALALENTVASDVPDTPDRKIVTRLNKGPAVTIADMTLIVSEKIIERTTRAADAAGVAWQYKRPIFGGTNAGQITRTRNGVPTGVVSVPCRYIHGPAAVMSVSDLIDAIKLVYQFCMI